MSENTKAKKVWTVEEITKLLQTNDEMLYRSMKKLYQLQTADEKLMKSTHETNGVGFNKIDAEFMTSLCEFLMWRGFLTDKQKLIARKRIMKYAKQLTKIANAQRS